MFIINWDWQYGTIDYNLSGWWTWHSSYTLSTPEIQTAPVEADRKGGWQEGG